MNKKIRNSILFIILTGLIVYLIFQNLKLSFVGYIWLLIGVVDIILSILLGLILLIPFGIGCFITIIPVLFNSSFLLQVIVFLCTTLISWVFVYFNITPRKNGLNNERYVGAKGYVTEDINPPHVGRVFVLGNDWAACSNQIIHKDAKVIVESIDGVTLKVKEEE